MKPNPYESTASSLSPQPQRCAVRRYVVAFALAVSIGVIAAIPGALLINQEWQVFPTDVFSSDFNINGFPVSNATVITYSCATGVLLMFAGFVSITVGFRNWRANKNHENKEAGSMKERISKTVMYDIGRMAVIALIGIIYYQTSPTTTDAAQRGKEKAGKRTWQEVIDKRDFVKPDERSVLVKSLQQVSDCMVHLMYDPIHASSMTYTFTYMGKDVVTLHGHIFSSFASHDKVLYFAQYPLGRTGCTVLAIDLESGKTLWETSLHHQKPHGHSGYSNVVSLRMSNIGEVPGGKAGAAIVITGSESYCDYVEVLDSATGESLAIKEYRVGF